MNLHNSVYKITHGQGLFLESLIETEYGSFSIVENPIWDSIRAWLRIFFIGERARATSLFRHLLWICVGTNVKNWSFINRIMGKRF